MDTKLKRHGVTEKAIDPLVAGGNPLEPIGRQDQAPPVLAENGREPLPPHGDAPLVDMKKEADHQPRHKSVSKGRR